MIRFLPLAAMLLAAALAVPSSPANAAQSDWAEADNSRLRLLLVPGEDGTLSGGVEIALEPGWYTYWRTPGEAGIPPQLDFGGSDNVAAVEVHYPVPERHDDGTSLSLVYFDHVVFPLTVTPADPARPVELRLDALYGVCEKICIPAKAAAAVALAEGAPDDPLARIAIGEARRRVPGPPQPGRLAVESVTLDGEALAIEAAVPPEGPVDLFAEGPADWYLGQPEPVARDGAAARFRLDLAGRPQEAAVAGQTFRFVVVGGGEAAEQDIEVAP
ncbi:MAG TPA: protein-disulfide reductase DsbD domain-containing protein [Afifellaceae bacterium]|nr:protein-disulfide reductase DsbD domain-containing protein [Afifellaceae bacterium]